MKLAIMQPYFLPYLGYFQLMNHVDRFVIYDDVQFVHRGWVNRNQILVNSEPLLFTLPLQKTERETHINQRYISEAWQHQRRKLLATIRNAYSKAPYFREVYPMIEAIFDFKDTRLSSFLMHSLKVIVAYLEIQVDLLYSSDLNIGSEFHGSQRIIQICNLLKAKHYINPIGGVELYQAEDFHDQGLSLHFIKMGDVEYPQFKHRFVGGLSIIDVLMFNSVEELRVLLAQYSLVA